MLYRRRAITYRMLPVGGDASAPNFCIAQEVSDNQFKIAGSSPGQRASWQVTGIRQDHWANRHRIPVEEMTPENDRGYYLHPDLFHAPEEKGIGWAHKPESMQRMKEAREQRMKENR